MSLDSLDPTFTQDVPCVKEFFVLDMIVLHVLCLFRLFDLIFFSISARNHNENK